MNNKTVSADKEQAIPKRNEEYEKEENSFLVKVFFFIKHFKK